MNNFFNCIILSLPGSCVLVTVCWCSRSNKSFTVDVEADTSSFSAKAREATEEDQSVVVVVGVVVVAGAVVVVAEAFLIEAVPNLIPVKSVKLLMGGVANWKGLLNFDTESAVVDWCRWWWGGSATDVEPVSTCNVEEKKKWMKENGR